VPSRTACARSGASTTTTASSRTERGACCESFSSSRLSQARLVFKNVPNVNGAESDQKSHEHSHVTSPSPSAPALGCATEPPKSLNGKRGCALPKSFASYALLSSRHLFPPRLTLAGVRLPRVSREGFRLWDSFLRLQPSSTSRRAIAAVGFHTGFPSGRLTSSNVAT
jgi:hypothetical protein